MLLKLRGAMAASSVASLLVVTGCTGSSHNSSDGEFSRANYYHSSLQLLNDSSAAVVGTVTSQRVVADITPDTPFTISTVQVAEVHKGKATGILPGSTIEVRETGTVDGMPSVKYLTTGETYLLYLTKSGLPGALAEQYYITGADVGSYVKVAGGQDFQQLNSDPGDNLPSKVSESDLPTE